MQKEKEVKSIEQCRESFMYRDMYTLEIYALWIYEKLSYYIYTQLYT